MNIGRRPDPYILPSFSLTGDIVAYLRCGLAYRYQKIGRLPSSHPVQLWFGQFIHGVLEEAYREYQLQLSRGEDDLPPWEEDKVRGMIDEIKRRLAAQNLVPWNEALEEIGDRRAIIAINELGPLLFPLIARAEVKLTGTRPIPPDLLESGLFVGNADRYEISGIIDVLTNVTLSKPSHRNSLLVQLILGSIMEQPPDDFEVIIDYKGMNRPPIVTEEGEMSYWNIYQWQVQTYAHLRQSQPDSQSVIAGVIIYLNELYPTSQDLVNLKRSIASKRTDIIPPLNSPLERSILDWNPGQPLPFLPFEFRLRRALRVVPISGESIHTALTEFDGVVTKIESCKGREFNYGTIIPNWEKNSSDESTCTACDAKTFCPSYTRENSPKLPRVRANA